MVQQIKCIHPFYCTFLNLDVEITKKQLCLSFKSYLCVCTYLIYCSRDINHLVNTTKNNIIGDISSASVVLGTYYSAHLF